MGKEKSIIKKLKLPDIKSLIFGTPKAEAPVLGSRFSNGTQALVPVVDIQQGIITGRTNPVHSGVSTHCK